MHQYISKLLIAALLLVASVTDVLAVSPYSYIPKNAHQYLPVLKKEIVDYFPEFPYYAYFSGLIEQESCISLTSNGCWNPKTQLLTAREEGAGLGQLTKAFNKNGKVRFDSLEAMRELHSKELKDLSWSNVLVRPDLQMRTIILMSKDNYNRLSMSKSPLDRIAFSDAAYNGGLGGLFNDRRICGLTKGCDPNVWDNNVERTCSKSKVAIYGHQSPCDINRTHVHNVLLIRMAKYSPLLNK